MKLLFLLILFFLQVIPAFGQNDNQSKSLIIIPINGAWIKLGDSENITDSTEAIGCIDYHFLHFDPVTKLVEVSYSNRGDWIPRGRGYFTLFDIEPYISITILRNYIQTTGDSTFYKEYWLKLAEIEFHKKISNE